MIVRVTYDIVLVCALFTTPFWFFGVMALLGILFFERYIESVIFFFVVDLLFHSPSTQFHTQSSVIMVPLSVYALIAVVLRTWIATYVRKRSL